MEAVLSLVKDLVCVALEDRRGDLLAPVGGQAVEHHVVGLGRCQQAAGELVACEIPQALLAVLGAGAGRVPDSRYHHVGVLDALGG